MSSTFDREIPRRAMIIDGDPTVRAAASALLQGANIEVGAAGDGEEALTAFNRRSFPVLVVDRDAPVIDGVEIVHRIRALAVAPVYIIMLTHSNDSEEYESGYCAGVDHYLPKQTYEAELVTRVTTGLVAIRRRQTTGAAHGQGAVIVDLASGAHTARHLVGRLHAEIALAARRGSPLTVLSVCVESAAPTSGEQTDANFRAACGALLEAVQEAVRPGLHWIARLPAAANAYRLAIVMPESPAAEVKAVEQSVSNTFVQEAGSLQLTIGAASLTQGVKKPTALELLGESERRRRGLGAKARNDIRNVQGDVSQGAEEA